MLPNTELTRRIERTLQAHNRPVSIGNVSDAPQCLRIRVHPVRRRLQNGRAGQLTRISHLESLADDLALALSVAPGGVSISQDDTGLYVEVAKPNPNSVILSLPTLEPRDTPPWILPLTLGLTVTNQPLTIDLANPSTPHLLVAGATGSGKTTLLRTILDNVLYLRNVARVAPTATFIVDTKQELTDYEQQGIAVLTDPTSALRTLDLALTLADDRYDGVDPGSNFPVLVLIDEYADLILRGNDRAVETSIVRLAQIGRGAGIHLVMATQRPSVDVMTGLIKANFTTRICLAVATKTDSYVVLDQPGAERLVGKGDALALVGGRLTRFQVGRVSGQGQLLGERDKWR